MSQTHQRIAVYGYILNQKQELLILKRSPHDSHPNIWELPGGGLEHGEEPEYGVHREVKEETGLSIQVYYPITARSGISSKDPSLQVVRIAYLCRIDASVQQIMLSPEHTDYQWIDPRSEISPLSDFLKYIQDHVQKFPHLINT